MKVLIFENEREYCESMFLAVDIIYYNKSIEYTWCNTSQESGDITSLNYFDIILVDLELSPQTQLDGYRIIEELIKYFDKNRIIILTGSSRVSDRLKEKNLPSFKVLKKPVSIEDIHVKFESALKHL